MQNKGKHKNIEIKAKCLNIGNIRNILVSRKADFKGIDHQIDTYFKIKSGRLKLREGDVENLLIFYKRSNISGPKRSDVILFKNDPESSLKSILVNSIDKLVVVDKKREIYFIDNIKFHLDKVKGLGTFLEIEAQSMGNEFSSNELLKQCEQYLELFNVNSKDFISVSYSDLLLKKKNYAK